MSICFGRIPDRRAQLDLSSGHATATAKQRIIRKRMVATGTDHWVLFRLCSKVTLGDPRNHTNIISSSSRAIRATRALDHHPDQVCLEQGASPQERFEDSPVFSSRLMICRASNRRECLLVPEASPPSYVSSSIFQVPPARPACPESLRLPEAASECALFLVRPLFSLSELATERRVRATFRESTDLAGSRLPRAPRLSRTGSSRPARRR